MELAERGQASLLEEERARQPVRFGRLWLAGRLKLACCLVLAATFGAWLAIVRFPGGRTAGSLGVRVGVPVPGPGVGGIGASPAPGEETLRSNIEALVRELHASSTYRRAVLEALSGGRKVAPGGARMFDFGPVLKAATSYVRKCDYSRVTARACDPPACSSDSHDLGVDCVNGACTRTCLVLTQESELLPGDAEGHPIVCGDDFAAIGPAAPLQLFNGTETTVEFVAESTHFVAVDLWGGGGGGTGARKVASSKDTDSLEVSMEGDSSFSGIYERRGTTFSGASWYQHSQFSRYLYYDPDCSNRGFGEGWFFSHSAPDTSRRMGLDPSNRYRSDNSCSYLLMKAAGRNSVPMGQQLWYNGKSEAAISIKFATTESWVCGGGGGGGAHVRALVELQAGQTYRFELGPGGAGGTSRKPAQNGQATRLLHRTEQLDWRVLAEAGGGFGAGPYNAAFQYSPGGQGGFSSPHRSHLETNPGTAGAASRSDLIGPSKILPPERLLGSKDQVCLDQDAESCTSVSSARIPCFSRSMGTYDSSTTVVNGKQFRSMCARVGARQPCGDVVPPRPGCSASSSPDWFLTCSSSFRLGSASDKSVMQCHGAAASVEADDPGTYWSHQGPFVSKPSIYHLGPSGGSAVAGRGAVASLGSGKGGGGMCPIMQKPPGSKLRALVKRSTGWRGSTGAATLSRCRRRGAYTLALQRCRERAVAAGAQWTLHGLWPEGAQSCRGEAFDPPALGDLRPRLEARWPSCREGTFSEDFWRWEWEKHGTCFGADQRRYFQLSLELLDRHAAACEAWRTDDCRLCLTANLELCAGLSDAPTSAGFAAVA